MGPRAEIGGAVEFLAGLRVGGAVEFLAGLRVGDLGALGSESCIASDPRWVLGALESESCIVLGPE